MIKIHRICVKQIITTKAEITMAVIGKEEEMVVEVFVKIPVLIDKQKRFDNFIFVLIIF